jgi:hypothetical protein
MDCVILLLMHLEITDQATCVSIVQANKELVKKEIYIIKMSIFLINMISAIVATNSTKQQPLMEASPWVQVQTELGFLL